MHADGEHTLISERLVLPSLQADTLAALAKQRGDLNATLLSECVNMRLAVYEKLGSHPVASTPVRHAIYK